VARCVHALAREEVGGLEVITTRGPSRCCGFVAAVVLLVGVNVPPVTAQCTGHASLNDFERSAFVSVANGKRPEVFAEFLSAEGCGPAMVHSLQALGAQVRFADQRVGYALVVLSKDKILDALDLSGIAYAFTSQNPYYIYRDSSYVPPSERKPAPVPAIVIPFPRVATRLPDDGPYFAIGEAGLTAFWREHAHADGRGVSVGVVDDGIDLLHPALQMARDGKGRSVPKIADIEPGVTPEVDPSWVQFGEPIRAPNGVFEAAGRSWTTAGAGTYRFGLFTKALNLGPDGNSHTRRLELSVGVLWDERGHQVWVDTDADGDFSDQRAMKDFAERHDVDFFGRKEGADDNRIPFAIKVDPEHGVYLAIGGLHGTLVAGPLAGNRRTGGLFDGAAPNAQLVAVDQRDWGGLQAAFLRAFARRDVDVINRSGHIGVPQPSGNEDFERHVLERAIAVYDKPIACYCGAANALHVMDYQSPEMLRRNTQASAPLLESITSSVWFTEDGLVNTVLAPSAQLITQSRYDPLAVLWEDGRLHAQVIDGVARLASPAPAGYAIGLNMSPTIPVVSGILADLITEARRRHVRFNAARLAQAVLTSARPVPGFPTSEQGFGLVNAASAWRALVEMAKADDPVNPILTAFVVERLLGGRRAKVNGFQADLPYPNQALEGELWVTRRGGYAGARRYRLSLRGDDGTYTLLDHRIALVRDTAVCVRFSARVKSGLHVAFLRLTDAAAGAVMQEIPLSARAPEVPTVVAPGVEDYRATIPPRRSEWRYVWVGEDVQAARFVMRAPYAGPSVLIAPTVPGFSPVGSKPAAGEAVDSAHHVGAIQRMESWVVTGTELTTEAGSDRAPQIRPGAQLVIFANRPGPEYETPYDPPPPDVSIGETLTVSKYAVAFTRADGETLWVTNRLARIRGRVELYNAAVGSSIVTGAGAHAAVSLERTLPSHLSQWRVAVSPTASRIDDVDAFLLDCTGKEGCRVMIQEPVGAAGATLAVDEPTEGSWRIVIRSRWPVERAKAFRVEEAALTLNDTLIPAQDSAYGSGKRWPVFLGPARRLVNYAAFRIAAAEGQGSENRGVRIAVTPLDRELP